MAGWPVGGAHEDNAPAADGQHRPHGLVEAIIHTAGLVFDNQIHTAVPSDCFFLAWEGHDPEPFSSSIENWLCLILTGITASVFRNSSIFANSSVDCR